MKITHSAIEIHERGKNTLLSQSMLTIIPFTKEIIIHINLLNVHCLSEIYLLCVYGEPLVKGELLLFPGVLEMVCQSMHVLSEVMCNIATLSFNIMAFAVFSQTVMCNIATLSFNIMAFAV